METPSSTRLSFPQGKINYNWFIDDVQSRIGPSIQYPTSGTTSASGRARSTCNCNYVFDPLRSYLSLLYWFCYFPSKISYDVDTDEFQRTKASLPRRVAVVLLHLLDVAIFFRAMQRPSEGDTPTLKLSFRLLYFMFLFAGVTFHRIAWVSEDKIVMLLNEMRRVGNKINATATPEAETRWKRKTSLVKWVSGFAFLIQGVLYAIILVIYRGNFSAFIQSRTAFLEIPAVQAEEFLSWLTGGFVQFEPDPVGHFESVPPGKVVYLASMASCWLLAILYNILVWSTSCASIFFWSYTFRLILVQFFTNSELEEKQETDILIEALKTFNEITTLLDKFNDIFGLNIFTIVLTCTLFITVNIWTVINSVSDVSVSVGPILVNSIVVVAYLLFTSSLLLAADVNNLGSSISLFIKILFQNSCSSLSKHAAHAHTVSVADILQSNIVTQSISIINSDVASSAIGLKGHGFFTLSYSFLGTVVSTIVTYSVIIMQFNTNDSNSSARTSNS